MPFLTRTTSTSAARPRAVWAAVITGAVLVVLIVPTVLLPVLALVGGADGATAGVLDVPVGQIAAALAIGYLLAVGLLLTGTRSRSGALAWVLAVAAVVSALLVSIWPLVVTAIAGASQTQEDVIPFLQQLLERVTAG